MKQLLGVLSLLIVFNFLPRNHAFAADLKSGDEVVIKSTEKLKNAYLFGKDIRSTANISDDIVAAGGNITLEGSATGSVTAAGGDIVIDTKVGNSIRAAGGTITIDGPVTNDVVIFGGTVTVSKSASIGGDLIFSGGNLIVDGPVMGKIIINGGTAVLGSKVGKNVEGNIGSLQLKSGAEIGGDLNYTSSQKALISDGAIIHGQTTYHVNPEKKDKNTLTKVFAFGTIFKLITDILFALLLVYLFPGIIKHLCLIAQTKPLKNSLLGLGFFIFVPIAALFLLLIIWLGISVWLLYFSFLILALMIGKILLGYGVINWWSKRNKSDYQLDYRAAIVGPFLMAILFLIPILGWLVALAIYFISLGSLLKLANELRFVTFKK